MIKRSSIVLTMIFLATVCALPARADLLIGDFSGGDTAVAHRVLRFNANASGDVAPSGSFTTSASGPLLQTPFHLTYEPVENVVYVADFFGQAIRVYPEDATGDVAPLRILNAPLIGQPRQVAISIEHDELLAGVSGCCLAAYARTASGNASALRFIQWGGSSGSLTRLNNPSGPVLRKLNDTLIVTDFQKNPDNSYSGLVLTFDRTANGNVAPLSSIEGNLTLLGSSAPAIAYDETHDELFVVAVDGVTATYRILTFSGAAAGNVAPLRDIEGPSANLNGVSALAYDSLHDLLFVTEGGYNGITANVLVFPRTANGNVAPARVLAGANTMLGYPIGITMTDGHIFKNGFE